MIILASWSGPSDDDVSLYAIVITARVIAVLLVGYAVAELLMRAVPARVTRILHALLLTVQVSSVVVSLLLGVIATLFLFDVLLEFASVQAGVASRYILAGFSLLWLGSCLISGAMAVPRYSFWQPRWRRWLGEISSGSLGVSMCVVFMAFIAIATRDPRAIIAGGAGFGVAEFGWWMSTTKRLSDAERAVAAQAGELICSIGSPSASSCAEERCNDIIRALMALDDSVRIGTRPIPFAFSSRVLVDFEVSEVIRALIAYLVSDQYEVAGTPLVRRVYGELSVLEKGAVLDEMVTFAADLRHLVIGSGRWVRGV